MKNLQAIIIITMFLTTASAFAQYSGGSGTETDPWQIACPNDLLYLAAHTEDYGAHFILTADINLADYTLSTRFVSTNRSQRW